MPMVTEVSSFELMMNILDGLWLEVDWERWANEIVRENVESFIVGLVGNLHVEVGGGPTGEGIALTTIHLEEHVILFHVGILFGCSWEHGLYVTGRTNHHVRVEEASSHDLK